MPVRSAAVKKATSDSAHQQKTSDKSVPGKSQFATQKKPLANSTRIAPTTKPINPTAVVDPTIVKKTDAKQISDVLRSQTAPAPDESASKQPSSSSTDALAIGDVPTVQKSDEKRSGLCPTST